jgi:hypothetical protein
VIEVRMKPGVDAAAGLTQVKLIAARFPGEHELRIRLVAEDGETTIRTLTLGPLWMYDGSDACLAALGEFGAAVLLPGCR